MLMNVRGKGIRKDMHRCPLNKRMRTITKTSVFFAVEDIAVQYIVLLARTYKGISVLQTSKRKNFNETLM